MCAGYTGARGLNISNNNLTFYIKATGSQTPKLVFKWLEMSRKTKTSILSVIQRKNGVLRLGMQTTD